MPTTKWSDLKKSQLDPERIEAITQKAREEILEMNLRELRQQVGLTQKQMADAIGVAQSQLSRMERRDTTSCRPSGPTSKPSAANSKSSRKRIKLGI